jgi:hypothetical protein
LEITQGNLRQDNVVSKLAEQLGTTIHETDSDPRNDKIFYLRNAFNNFVNIPYDQLDFRPDNDLTTLGSEGHSYSRLFTGTFYDVLIGLYESKRNELGDHGALSFACDLAAKIMLRAIEIGPVGELAYSDIALAMLDADRVYFNGENKDILIEEFSERKILSRQEAESHLKARENIPPVTLPSNISTPASALDFINSNKESLGIPNEIDLNLLSGYTNIDGYTFLNYFQTRRITLDGPQFGNFNGSPLDTFGGVSLLFDNNKRLTNLTIRLVSEEDVRQIKKQIEILIKLRQIEAVSQSSLPLLNKLTRTTTITEGGKDISVIRPVLGVGARGVEGELKLIRHPIHVDVINPNALGIEDFVKQWSDVYKNK